MPPKSIVRPIRFPERVLRQPRNQQKRLFRVVGKVIDRLPVMTNELENCRTAYVSNVEPDGLWRWPEKERKLAKVRVLGDNDEIVLSRVIPNLAIRRLSEIKFRYVRGAGKLLSQ